MSVKGFGTTGTEKPTRQQMPDKN